MEDLFSVKEEEGAIIVQVQNNKIDMLNVPEFRSFFDKQLDSKPGLIIVDLEKTQFIDSSAIGYFFKLHKDITAYGGKLCLTCLQTKVNRVLSINGADRYLECYDTVKDAIASASA